MHGEINSTINVLPPFKYFCNSIGELPTSYLESMTYYETIVWLCNYLKETIIPTVNNTGNAVTELQNLYVQLENYVNTYFDNLDVQEEINKKLDDMAETGELTNLISNYIDPLFSQKVEEIDNTLDQMNTKINSIASGNPIPVSSIENMTDTSRVYVLTTDGNWYYYNGTTWAVGGIYQSTQLNFNNTLNDFNSPSSSIIIGKNLDGLYTPYETFEYTKVDTGSEYYNIYLNQNEILKITSTNLDVSCGSRISLRTSNSNNDNDIILDQYVGNYTLIYKLPKPFFRIQFYSNRENSHLKIEKINLNYNPLNDNFLKNTLISYNIKENIYNYSETLSSQKGIVYDISIKKDDLLHIKGINSNDNIALLFQQYIDNEYVTIDRIYSNIRAEGIDVYYHANNNFDRIQITFYNSDQISTQYYLSIDRYKNKTNKKFVCFGDSLTSDQVCGIGTLIGRKINASIINNFAVGYATCTDWHIGDTNTTPINLEEPANAKTNDNTLSNQIRRCLQWTTPLNQQISWNYLTDTYSIDTSYGTGLGHTEDIPDIIYIAIGINDGDDTETPYDINDLEEVIHQDYNELTRNSMASALKWAIETLRCAYPLSQIYVATPIQTQRKTGHTGTDAYMYKRNIIKTICESESCTLIDSTVESGVSKYMIQKYNRVSQTSSDLHPSPELSHRIANYVSNEIKNKYFV